VAWADQGAEQARQVVGRHDEREPVEMLDCASMAHLPNPEVTLASQSGHDLLVTQVLGQLRARYRTTHPNFIMYALKENL